MSDYYLQFSLTGNSYVNVPTASALNPETSSFAVFMWAKPAALVGGILITKDNPDVPGWYMSPTGGGDGNGVFGVWIVDSNSNNAYFHPDYFLAQKRTLFGFVINRTTQLLSGYIDGVLIGTPVDISTVGSINPTVDMQIGAWDYGPGYVVTRWGGLIDGVEIYKGVAAESVNPLAIYNNGVGRKITGSEAGLVWASNCDNGSGTTVTDLVSGNNGTIADATKVTWVAGSIPFISFGGNSEDEIVCCKI